MDRTQAITLGKNGLSCVRLEATDGARAEIYLQGAHVTTWRPAGGVERLYLSERAEFRPGAAIRGGIPVIFPQFSDRGPLPRHGFARTAAWDLAEAGTRADGAAWAVLRLQDAEATRKVWPEHFVADLRVEVGGQRLTVALLVTNAGAAPFTFTAALHTYLAVADIATVTVDGLGGVAYEDQAAGGARRVQTDPVVVIAGEVDRIYYDAPACTTVHTGIGAIEVCRQNFADTVVWNPGPEKAAGLADMPPQDYRHMLCVEAAAIGTPVHVDPGQQWSGIQTLQALA